MYASRDVNCFFSWVWRQGQNALLSEYLVLWKQSGYELAHAVSALSSVSHPCDSPMTIIDVQNLFSTDEKACELLERAGLACIKRSLSHRALLLLLPPIFAE